MVIDLTPKASLEEIMGVYLEQFKHLLDCPKRDREYLTSLASSALGNIACDVPNVTYTDFVENLDTPSHFAQALQDELDQNSLRRYRRRRRLCFIGGIAAVIALWIALSASLSLYWHGQYVASQRLNDKMALVIFPAERDYELDAILDSLPNADEWDRSPEADAWFQAYAERKHCEHTIRSFGEEWLATPEGQAYLATVPTEEEADPRPYYNAWEKRMRMENDQHES